MGTQILGLSRTGDFEGRHAELVLDIYNRISGGSSLLPPAIGFIFDRECKTQQKRDELKTRSKGKAIFTSRRMYENYLLNPGAIAEVVNAIEDLRGHAPVTEEGVQQLIEAKRGEESDYCSARLPEEPDRWIVDIDAAGMLKDIFNELSETRVAFNKVEHSVALTDWILEHSPEVLREIADLLESALPDSPAQS